jgi:exonuclease SbcC
MLQKLKGREKPDIEELEERVQRNREQYGALQIAYSEIQKARVEEEILRQIKELHEKNREREKTLEKRKGFIKMLKGSHGVGIQRYILGVMLSTVIREANHILQTVLEGRYTIHRTDEGAGKKGLELAVCSYGEGEGRLVKTLSGGEKFLISLCLAIGLSSVVQAQGGGRVEALFVDEGFGTLDRERLDDAVNILQMSRRETDVIGIISHVEALREIIPAKIRIQKAKTGSTLLVEA